MEGCVLKFKVAWMAICRCWRHSSSTFRRLGLTRCCIRLAGVRSDLDIPGMWRQVCGVVHEMLGRLAGISPPSKSALSQARTRLGARPMRQLLLGTGRSLPAGAEVYTHYKGMPMLA